jgi:predicted nucleic acid-binding protein
VKGYLVDTNVPSELTRETPDARVVAVLRKAGKESLFLSVMTLGEICKGIDMLPASQKRDALLDWLEVDVRSWYAGRILPVTESIAERWGHLAARAKQQGIALKAMPDEKPWTSHRMTAVQVRGPARSSGYLLAEV